MAAVVVRISQGWAVVVQWLVSAATIGQPKRSLGHSVPRAFIGSAAFSSSSSSSNHCVVVVIATAAGVGIIALMAGWSFGSTVSNSFIVKPTCHRLCSFSGALALSCSACLLPFHSPICQGDLCVYMSRRFEKVLGKSAVNPSNGRRNSIGIWSIRRPPIYYQIFFMGCIMSS